jgi:GT2 family glycosyltransferase
MKVLIIVCTQNIRSNLFLLLEQLSVVRNNSSIEFRVLVVWDSPSEIPSQNNSNIAFVRAHTSGYASVRNLGLTHRDANESGFFIDDDELVLPQSLSRLRISSYSDGFLRAHLQACLSFTSSIFVGSVIPISNKGEFVSNYRNTLCRRHGEVINFASGGNLFIPAQIFSTTEVKFDEFFNFGGEDSDLSYRLNKSGIFTRWNNDSILYEITETERLTSSWQYNRFIKNEAINILIFRRNESVLRSIGFTARNLLGIPFMLLKLKFQLSKIPSYFIFKLLSIQYLVTGNVEKFSKFFLS